jgi:flavodoxin
MRILVAYYSRSGTTRKAAEAISQILKCETEEILDTKNRAGILGWLRSGMDATFKRFTVIEEVKKNPVSCDIVIIGTPVWNSTMSAPIRTRLNCGTLQNLNA